MSKVFVFDASKCNGCYNCQVACKDEHVGNDWLPYAKSQPNTGQFWLKVNQKEHGQVPMVKVEYTAWMCMHCKACLPQQICPAGAFIRTEEGLLYIDPEKCNGCMACVEACPFKVIYANEELNIAQKCTGCAHLVAEGKTPHCVDFCATGALRFGEKEDFKGELDDAEFMLPAYDYEPNVYYINMPHLFMGGEVYDPVADEIIEGAKVTITRNDGLVWETLTDDFGDFKIERLAEGIYDIHIEAEGFEPIDKSIQFTKSTYLGEFPLTKL